MKKKKIYLAGPFFNEQQLADQQKIETMCKDFEQPFFSPRLELVLKPDASEEQRSRVFQSNVAHVRGCRLVLANIEGRDTGTLWEMGAAYGFGTPVVAYSPDPSRKLNVMLAYGVRGYLAGWDAVRSFLNGRGMEKIGPEQVPNLNWGAAQAWQGKIF